MAKSGNGSLIALCSLVWSSLLFPWSLPLYSSWAVAESNCELMRNAGKKKEVTGPAPKDFRPCALAYRAFYTLFLIKLVKLNTGDWKLQKAFSTFTDSGLLGLLVC